jgi:uncharacterized protein (TIGR04141 family)
VENAVTLFDFDRDSSILRRLTGKVKEEHKKLFKHATGASNLRVSTDIPASELSDLCATLLDLYESHEYKATFPDIQNIAPVRDPSLTEQLNAKLVEAVRQKDEGLDLSVPDLIHYEDGVYAAFRGAGKSLIYEDVFIGRLYEYLESHAKDLNAIGVEELRHYALLVTDEHGSVGEQFSIYKSLIFDTTLDGVSFHLCEGNWYRVEKDYVSKIEAYLDPRWTKISLPPYEHESEGAYNKSVSGEDKGIICLDESNISLQGQAKIEPCDLYSAEDGYALFQHVKVSTLSAKLSHLFNQGTNAIELLRLESAALNNLKAVIKEKAAKSQYARLVAPLDSTLHHVIFAIVTHKDPKGRSKNLPLFSRISLMRNLKALQVRGVKGSFGFIEDKTPQKEGTKRKRRKKDE